MAETATLEAPATVTGDLTFIIPQDKKPEFHSAALTGGDPKVFFKTEERPVEIEDMRDKAATFSIEREGFELLTAPTSVADDPVPQRTRPKPGFLAAQSVDKQSHRTIQSQMAKSRLKIVMTFSAEGSGDQPFGGSDDRLDALLGMPIGFSRWLTKTAVGVGLSAVIGDQQQIVDRLFSENHRLRSFTHRRCRANLARS